MIEANEQRRETAKPSLHFDELKRKNGDDKVRFFARIDEQICEQQRRPAHIRRKGQRPKQPPFTSL
jgi:hypothetical protein